MQQHKRYKLMDSLTNIQNTLEYLEGLFSCLGSVNPSRCYEAYDDIHRQQTILEGIVSREQNPKTLKDILPVQENFMLLKLTQKLPELGELLLECGAACTTDIYKKERYSRNIKNVLQSTGMYIKKLTEAHAPQPPVFSLN